MIAVGELVYSGIAHRLSLFIHPCEGLGHDMIDPQTDMAGSQDQRQAVIAFPQFLGHPLFPDTVVEVIDNQAECDNAQSGCHFPYPFGNS